MDRDAAADIRAGILHEVPDDLRDVLVADGDLRERWNGLTPIQRNEWICWTTLVKQPQTRAAHLARLQQDLRDGVRRPCCWPGCPHRRPAAARFLAGRKR